MTKKKALFPLAAAALLAVSGASALQAGAVVYNIVDYPSLENGWNLSGTITTDGTIGTLTASDITAWSWTLADGENTETWSSSSTGSGGAAPLTGVSGLDATATELELGTPGQNTIFYLDLSFNGQGSGAGDLSWTRRGPGYGTTDDYSAYFSPGGILFNDNPSNPPGLTLTDSANWVIAQVPSPSSAPEPGTVGLLALGVAGLAVARARRTA